MAVLPIRVIIRALARGAAAEAGRRALGPVVDPVLDRVREELGLDDLAEAGEQNVRQALDDLLDRGEINRQQIERAERALARSQGEQMVDFNQFMSIGLSRCGNDPQQFRALTTLWNRNRETIQDMTPAELRDRLRCP